MTEATAGSATVIQPDAGALATAANGAADQGSNGVTVDPFAGLETGAREWVGTKGYKSTADVVKAALAAENLIGRSIQLPGDDAKPEDVDKFLQKATAKYVPKDVNGFEFKALEGLPAEFAYDGEREKAFKADALAAGLTPKQAAALRDAEVKRNAEAFTKLQETVKASATTATAALEKAWGGPKDSDPYKAGMALAGRALAGLEGLPGVKGIQAALEGAGVLMSDGAGGSIIIEPTIAVALAEIGKRLFKEDSLELGSTAAVGDNPFAGEGNLTIQMQMIRSDPSKARRMISAVGKTPADFMWDGKDVPAQPK